MATFSKIATTTIVVVIARVAAVVVMVVAAEAVIKVDEMASLAISSNRAVLVVVPEVVEMEECLVTVQAVETTTHAVASSSTTSVNSRVVSSIETKVVATVTTPAGTIATATTIAATGITIALAAIGAITTAAMTVAEEGKIGAAVMMDRAVVVMVVLAAVVLASTIGATIEPTGRSVGMMMMKTGKKQEATNSREPRRLGTLVGKMLSDGTSVRGDNRVTRRNRTSVKSKMMMIEHVTMVHPVVELVAIVR